MNEARSGAILEHIRKFARIGSDTRLSDRELLARFAHGHDEAAFAALVQRHGAMILQVCRRIVHNLHDAEDICQATFFVLASRAATRKWHDSVGNWLYQVAYRLSLRARSDALRRRRHESRMGTRPALQTRDEITAKELQAALDEELFRLPDKYQVPLVLCYLQGATRDEAARQLGWPLGTLKNRVERGRALLRNRLSARGLTLSAALIAAILTEGSAQAVLSVEEVKRITQVALLISRGQVKTAATGTVPALRLAHSMLRAMFLR